MSQQTILFSATNGTTGYELWVTDGTSANTSLLKDINGGVLASSPQGFFGLGNGRVVFQATTAAGGAELWISDGTSAGTSMVRDINSGAASSNPTLLATLSNGRAIFSATDGTHGVELWATNGTSVGTYQLQDINGGTGDSTPASAIVLGNGKALFRATDATHGTELWITDGTSAGTSIVMDIDAGTASSTPAQMVLLPNGKMVFRATDATHGAELWITDGTSTGTSMVRDINTATTGNIDGYPNFMASLGNGKVLFRAYTAATGVELWVTDGTSAGTSILKDIRSGTGSGNPNTPTLVPNGSSTPIAVFKANDLTHGIELWVSDGTSAGTSLLKDINTTGSISASSAPQTFTSLGGSSGKVLFVADNGSQGYELWVTNGTSGGTSLVRDINPGAGSSNPTNFTAIGGGKALFQADDGSHGPELWITDGTSAGTSIVKDINGTGTAGSNPSSIVAFVVTSAPVITGFTPDTGTAGDGITNTGALTVNGTATAADIVTLFDGATQIGTAAANAGGAWSITPGAALAEGSHTLSAFATEGGLISPTSASFTIQVDTTAPLAPAITAISSDTGSNGSDGITKTASQTVSGTAEIGSTLALSNGGTLVSTVVTDGTGHWSSGTITLASGSNTLTATATDVAGNVSSAGTFVAVLDSAVPAPPSITGISNDTGSSASDGITTTALQVVRGTAEAGSTLNLSNGGTLVSTVVTDGAGHWSSGTITLASGSNTLTATATDAAGNISSAGSYAAVLDTAAPALSIGLSNNTGSVANVTSNATLSGTSDATAVTGGGPGDKVLLSIDGGAAVTVTAGVAGAWVYVPTLADGTHTVSASETDIAGNVGSGSLVFVLDTVAPPVSLLLVSDTGLSASDKITNDARINGTGDGSQVAVITEGSTTLGSTTAGTGGVWGFSPTLSDGSHTLTATETDTAGNVRSATLAFTLDTVAPTVSAGLVADTGSSSSDKITNDKRISGNGQATAVVTITEGSLTLGTTTADASGAWNYTPTLADGAHALTASETDISGNVGSNTLAFTLDTTSPAISVGLVADTGSSDSDKITNDKRISGTGDANAIVTINEGTVTLGSTTADASGAWSYTPPTLSNAAHTLTAVETDKAGNTGSGTFGFTLDTVAPTIAASLVTDTGSSNSDKITSDTRIHGTSQSGAVITITEGGATLGSATTDASGSWSVTPTLPEGAQTLTVTATDVAGNAASVTLAFTLDTILPPVTVLLLNDIGSSASDTITNDKRIRGSGDASTKVTITEGATTLGSTTADASGSWSFNPPSTLANAVHTLTATETDTAGNVGHATLVFTLDTVAPTVSVGLVADTGGSATDKITSDNRLSGKSESGAVITIIEGTSTFGSTTADASGNWSVAPSLPEGAQTATAVATDVAGNAANATLAFTLDTNAPVLAANVVQDSFFDVAGTWVSPGYFISAFAAPGWTGSSGAGVSPENNGLFWDNGNVPGQSSTHPYVGFIQAAGTLSQTIGGLLVGGSYTVTFYANARADFNSGASIAAAMTDTSGTVLSQLVSETAINPVDSSNSFTQSFQKFTTSFTASAATEVLQFLGAPLVAGRASSVLVAEVSVNAVHGLSAVLVTDSGVSGTDGITNNAALTGTAEIGSTITILNGATTLTATTADASGKWSVTPTLNDGHYSLTVRETDIAGNSVASSISVTVDTTAPALPGNKLQDGTFDVLGTWVSPGGFDPAFFVPGWYGNGSAGVSPANGIFWDNGSVPGQSFANPFVGFIQGGSKLSQTVSGLTIGATYDLSFYANARVSSGTQGAAGLTVAMTDTAGNALTQLISPSVVYAADSYGQYLQPFQHFTASFVATAATETLTFIGTPVQPSQDTSVLIAEVSLTGTHPLTAALVSDTGSSSTDSNTSTAALKGTAEANATITILNGATTLTATTADGAGNWSVAPSLADGSHGLTVRETDIAGNSASTTLAFTLDRAAPVLAGNVVQDPLFDVIGTWVWPGYFTSDFAAPGWTGSSGAGVSTANSGGFWDNGSVPGQSNLNPFVGFIQGAGTLSQTLGGLLVGGSYTVTFYANGRADFTSGASIAAAMTDTSGHVLTQLVAKTAINPVNANNAYTKSFQKFTATFTASAATEVLQFSGAPLVAGRASSVLIAEVGVDAVRGLSARLAADSGASGTDGITNNATLTGVAEAGSTITILDGATALTATTADASGKWSVTPTLNDGHYSLTVRESDLAGNSVATSVAFTLDATAPALPGNKVQDGTFDVLGTWVSPGVFDPAFFVPGWYGTGAVGVSPANGLYWDNGSVPGQSFANPFVGFIQGGSKLSQTVSGLTIGATYDLSFYANARVSSGTQGAAGLTVAMTDTAGNALTQLISPSVVYAADSLGSYQAPFQHFASSFVATSTTETLNFVGTPIRPNEDTSVLIAGVSLTGTHPLTVGLKSDTGLNGGDFITRTTTLTGTAEAGATITILNGATTLTATTADGAGAWSVTPSLTDGSYSLTVRETDIAGNSASTTVSLTRDTTAPALMTNLMTDPYFDVTGKWVWPGYFSSTLTAAGWSKTGNVGISTANGAFWDNGSVPGQAASHPYVAFVQGAGTLSQTVSNLIVGETYRLSFYANARDDLATGAGLSVAMTTSKGTVLSPVIAPTAVGIADSYNRYQSPFQAFSATFVASATSEVLRFSGNPMVAGQDNSVLIAGVNLVNVHGLSAALVSDSGKSASDGVTNSSALRGTSEAGSLITILNGTTALTSTFADGEGAWSVTPGLADGSYTLTVRETDAAGNSNSMNVTLVLDATRPVIEIMHLVSDTGLSGSDNVTSDPVIEGTGDGSATVVLTEGSTVLTNTLKAGTGGVWRYLPALDDGVHTITATETDTAGNTGSQTLTFTLDRTAPALPGNLLQDPTFDVAGNWVWPGLFDPSFAAPGWSGTGAAGVTPANGVYWDNGSVPGQSPANPYVGFIQGASTLSQTVGGLTIGATYDVSFYANARAYNATGTAFSAEMTDSVGQVLSRLVPVTGLSTADAYQRYQQPFQYFTTSFVAVSSTEVLEFKGAPQVPGQDNSVLIAEVSLTGTHPLTASLVSDTGASATDTITNNPALHGIAEPNSLVTILNGTNTLTAATADLYGNWSATPDLPDGKYSLTVRETDPAGNSTETSVGFTLDRGAPPVQVLLLQDTGASSSDLLTKDPTLQGTGDGGAAVTLTEDGTVIGTGTAGAGGVWAVVPTLSQGNHTVTATEIDAAGNVGSRSFNFTFDSAAPLVTAQLANDTGDSKYDHVTNDPALKGTTDPGTTVIIYENGIPLTSATADSNGNWSVTPTMLTDGAHTLLIQQIDAADNLGYQWLTFTLDRTGALTPQELIQNPYFDQVGTWSDPGFFSGVLGASNWASAGRVGISPNNNEYWDNGYVPGQDTTSHPYVAFLQNSTILAQTFNNLIPGQTYTLSFYADARASVYGPPGTTAAFSVTMNGQDNNNLLTTVLGTTAISAVGGFGDHSRPFQLFTTAFTAVNTTEVLSFNGIQTVPGADTTVLIADVSMQAPTPAHVVTAALTYDTGDSSTDGLTNNNTLHGTGDPNRPITIYGDNLAPLITTTADALGNWSVIVPLADGGHTLLAQEVDAAGNLGYQWIGLTLDRIAPVAVTTNLVSNPGFALSASGRSPGYFSTGVAASGWSGWGTAGVTGASDDGFWNNGSPPGEAPPLPNYLPDSSFHVGFVQYNGKLRVELDGLLAGQSYDLSYFANSRIYDAADHDGSFSVTLDDASWNVLTNVGGTHVIHPVGQADPHLNIYRRPFASFSDSFVATASTEYLTFNGIIPATGDDTTVLIADVVVKAHPPAHALSFAPSNYDSISGASYVVKTSDALTGTAEPNRLVTIYEGTTALGAVTADASGNWSFEPNLHRGNHSLSATETDAAGNMATTSIQLDAQYPIHVLMALTTDTGTLSDAITSNWSLTGAAGTNQPVTIKEGSTVLATVTADASGNWSFTPTLVSRGTYSFAGANHTFADTTHTLTATGSTGSASESVTLTFTLNTSTPQVSMKLASDTGTSTSDLTTSNPKVTGGGSAKGLATIQEGSTTLGTATANTAGSWSFTPTLNDGLHTLTVSETNVAGTTGSVTTTFTLDRAAPAVTIGLVSDTGTSGSDNYTNDARISGTGDANATVTITEGGTSLGTAVADSNGAWTFDAAGSGKLSKPYAGTTGGSHTLVATETDAAGNIGSASLKFTLDNTAPSTSLPFTTLVGGVNQFNALTATNVQVSMADGSAWPFPDISTVTITSDFSAQSNSNWNDQFTAQATGSGSGGTITGNGTAKLTIVGTLAQINADLLTLGVNPPLSGKHTITISASDQAGNAAPAQTITFNANAKPVFDQGYNYLYVPVGKASLISMSGISGGNAGDKFTVGFEVTGGTVSANANNTAATIINAGTNKMEITGTSAAVNSALATFTYTPVTPGDQAIRIYTIDTDLNDQADPKGINFVVNGLPTIHAPSLMAQAYQHQGQAVTEVLAGSIHTPTQDTYLYAPATQTVTVNNGDLLSTGFGTVNLDAGGISISESGYLGSGDVTFTVTLTSQYGQLFENSSKAAMSRSANRSISFNGTLKDTNAFLAGVQLLEPAANPTPGAAPNNRDLITVNVSDSLTNRSTQTIAVDIQGALQLTAPGALITGLNWQTGLPGILMSQVQADFTSYEIVSVVVSCLYGALAVTQIPGVIGGASATSKSLTLTGYLPDVNTALSTLLYTSLAQEGTDFVTVKYAIGANPAAYEAATFSIATVTSMPSHSFTLTTDGTTHYFATANGQPTFDEAFNLPQIAVPGLPQSLSTSWGVGLHLPLIGGFGAGLVFQQTLKSATFDISFGLTGTMGGYTLSYGLNIGASIPTRVTAPGAKVTIDTSHYRATYLNSTGLVPLASVLGTSYIQVHANIHAAASVNFNVNASVFGNTLIDYSKPLATGDFTIDATPKAALVFHGDGTANGKPQVQFSLAGATITGSFQTILNSSAQPIAITIPTITATGDSNGLTVTGDIPGLPYTYTPSKNNKFSNDTGGFHITTKDSQTVKWWNVDLMATPSSAQSLGVADYPIQSQIIGGSSNPTITNTNSVSADQLPTLTTISVADTPFQVTKVEVFPLLADIAHIAKRDDIQQALNYLSYPKEYPSGMQSIPLGVGSVNFGYTIISANLYESLSLAEKSTFTPDRTLVSGTSNQYKNNTISMVATFGNGTTVNSTSTQTGYLGGSFDFTTPSDSDGVMKVTATYTINGTVTSHYGVHARIWLDVTALQADFNVSINLGALGSFGTGISIPPIYQHTFDLGAINYFFGQSYTNTETLTGTNTYVVAYGKGVVSAGDTQTIDPPDAGSHLSASSPMLLAVPSYLGAPVIPAPPVPTVSTRSVIIADGGTVVIANGAVTQGDQVVYGGVEKVQAGGAVYNSGIYDGGREWVQTGGWAFGTTLDLGGMQIVDDNATASGAVLAGGTQDVTGLATLSQVGAGSVVLVEAGGSLDAANVLSGGTVELFGNAVLTGGTFASGSLLIVENGATLSGFTVGDGITLEIAAGGTASLAVIQSGGAESIDAGGTDTGASIVAGGHQGVLGTAASVTIGDGGVQDVGATGTATGTMIGNGGIQNIDAGGTVSATQIGSGGLQYVTGSATNTTIADAATQYVTLGGSATTTHILSGGQEYVGSDSTDIDTDIASGGLQLVLGTASNTSVTGIQQSTGATFGVTVNDGGVQAIGTGALDVGTTIKTGGTQYLAGNASAASISGGTQLILSGGIATSTGLLSGSLLVAAGGAASGAAVSGGTMDVVGTADLTVLTGGTLIAEIGGVVSNTAVSAGGLLLVTNGGTAGANVIGSYGLETVALGGIETSSTIGADGVQDVSGTATDTRVQGGTQTVESGGVANSATISAGGLQSLLAGGKANTAKISGGGVLTLASGASADGVTIGSSGSETVAAGATDSNATIQAHGAQSVAGLSSTATIDGGTQTVATGGTATTATVIHGGAQMVYGVVSDTLLAGGYQSVFSGGTASGTHIGLAGTLHVMAGGTANDVTFTGAGGTLVLDDPTGLTGVLSGWQAGAVIDFAALSVTAAYTGATSLTVRAADGSSYTYALSDSVGTAHISLADDGNGGTELLLDGPYLAVPGAVTLGVGQAGAVSGIVLAEVGAAYDATVTVSALTGTLSAIGASGNGTGTLTIQGSIAAINASLATLTDAETAAGPAVIVVDAVASNGATATRQLVAATVNGTPTASGPTAVTLGVGQSHAVAGIFLAETGNLAGETFSVTVDDTNGALSATGATGNGTMHLSLTGALADINTALASLAVLEPSKANDTLLVHATDSYGNASLALSVALAVVDLPVIAIPGSQGLAIGQSLAIEGISLAADVNDSYTLNLAAKVGTLTASGSNVIGSGTGSLQISGSQGAINASLSTLAVSEALAGSDTVTVAATSGGGISALSQSIALNTWSNPMFTAPSDITMGVGTTAMLSGGTLAQSDATADERFTVTISIGYGVLSVTADPAVVDGNGSNSLTLSGDLATVNAAIATLGVTSGVTGADAVTFDATDSLGGAAGEVKTNIMVNGAPVITAPLDTRAPAGSAKAVFAGGLSEMGNTANEQFTLVVADTTGQLSVNAGNAMVSGDGSTSLTISGGLTDVSFALATLTVLEAAPVSDTITITATDSFGNTAAQTTTQITVNGPPVITAPAAIVFGVDQFAALSGADLTESGDVFGESFTVTISDTVGLLVVTPGSATVTNNFSTSLTINGTLATVNKTLATLVGTSSTPGADTVTIAVTDSLGGTASQTTSIMVNGAPVLAAPATAALGIGKAASIAGASVAETGTLTGETFTIVLGDSIGVLSVSASGAAKVTSNASTSVTVCGALADVNATLATLSDTAGTAGPDTITLHATDSFGNTASQSSIAVSVKPAPTVALALASDTGASASDGLTANPALAGSADAGATVMLAIDGAPAVTATASGSGAWAYSPTGLAQGDHTIVASDTDAFGNSGSASLSFTYDSIAPTITAALASDTGGSATDAISAIATLNGTAEANGIVTLKEGAITIGNGTANAAGAWMIMPTYSDGSHTITASQTDSAGNTGTATFAFTLDTVAPGVTVMLATDTGTQGDAITSNAALKGAGDGNAVVSIRLDGAAAVLVMASGTGAWAYTPRSLSQGSHSIAVSETDTAGNTGTASISFTYDTIAPTVTAALVSDTGTSSADGITSYAALSGTAEANAVVSLSVDGGTAINTTAVATGLWSYTPTGLSQGSHSVTASETDVAGNTGTASLSYIFDSIVPNRPVITAISPDTGPSASDGITRTGTISISGTAEAGSIVTLFDAGAAIGTATANGAGDWTATPSSALTAGTHTLTAKATDAAGNLSAAATAFAVKVQPAPTLTAATLSRSVTEGLALANLWSSVIGNGIDLGTLTISAVNTTGTMGYVVLDAAHQSLTYQAKARDALHPTDSFTYTLTDDQGFSVTGTITVGVTAAAAPTLSSSAVSATVTATTSGQTLDSLSTGQKLVGNAAGGDTFFGGTDTQVNAAGASNTITLAPGNHSVAIGTNNNKLTAGDGSNTISGTGTGNTIVAGTGTNLVSGLTGTSTITLGNGNNTITISGAGNVINVGNGNNTITISGTGGTETMTAGNGNNTMTASGSGDIFTAGYGNNTINANGAAALVTLGSGVNNVTLKGTGSSAVAGNGGNTIAAKATGAVIITGSGNDTLSTTVGGAMLKAGLGTNTISFAGSGSTIVNQGGTDTLTDTGTNNTIVLGSGLDVIVGSVLTNGDLFDLRPLLATTTWDHLAGDLNHYLALSSSGGNALVSLLPTGSGSGTVIAQLNGAGNVSLAAFLSHAQTI